MLLRSGFNSKGLEPQSASLFPSPYYPLLLVSLSLSEELWVWSEKDV
jgi:hypothetical protein